MAGARETRAVCLSISVYLVGRVATAEPVAQDGPRRVEGGELLDGGGLHLRQVRGAACGPRGVHRW